MAIIAIKELIGRLPPRARLLGVDHGEKTLGLAISNPELTLASPLKTIRRTKFTENIQELATLCREYGVAGFVIGLPLNMDDSEGPRAQSVRHFGLNLLKSKDVFGFEPLVAYWDERLSTFSAEQMLIDDLNMPRKKRGAIIDQLAATQILQGALDALRQP